MKKIKDLILIFGSIFFLIYLILSIFLKSLPLYSILLLSILISILILFLYRKKTDKLKSSAQNTYFATTFAGLINFPILLIFFNEIFPKTKTWVWISLIILMLLILLASFFLIFLKIIRSGYVLIPLFILNISILLYYYNDYKKFLNQTDKALISFGYSFDLQKIFPFKESIKECEVFIEKTKKLTSPDWDVFYKKNLSYFLDEYFLEIFQEGKKIKIEVEKNKLEEFFKTNEEIKKEMGKCPYMQWADPEKYLKEISHKTPDVFSMIRWTRFLFSTSQIFMFEGDIEKAEEQIQILRNLYEKINLNGQIFGLSLLRNYIQSLIILNNAAYLQIFKKPLSTKAAKEIETFSRDDLSFTFNSLFLEYLPIYNLFKKPKYIEEEKISKLQKETLKILFPVLGNGFMKYYVSFWYGLLKLKKEVSTEKNIFAYEKYKKISQRKSFFLPNISNIYPRTLTIVAQARAVYVSNEVFKYLEKNKKLPEDLKFIEKNLKIDPFTEKEFIYKKESDFKFMVYSTGEDQQDDGCKNLHFLGPWKRNDNIKKDIGFSFTLPE